MNSCKMFTDGTVTNEMTQIHNNLPSYETAIIKILYKQNQSIFFFKQNTNWNIIQSYFFSDQLLSE